MAYEKYIKKDGKLYGPYIYHSRRIDGKVVSEYHGQKTGYGKFLWIIAFALLIILGAYFIGQRQSGPTGYSVLDLNADYQEGQALSGEVKLSLQEGELIPASSAVVFENAGNKYEYLLKDLILEPTAEGSFFIKEKNISGSGEGFGISGTKEIYPEVYFTLIISSEISQEEGIVTESEKEIQGSASAGNTFTYTLQEGETAKIKLRSVKTDSVELSEDSVSLTTEGGLVSISTDYSEEEEGFGEEYTGEKIKELTVNLGSLEILPEKGELKVGIFYEGEELVSMQTTISDGTVSSESEVIPEAAPPSDSVTDEEQVLEPVAPVANETFNASDIIETKSFNITFPELELTAEERAVLEREFVNISLEAKETKIKNGFIIIRYELREDTWVDYSYSSDLDNETLNIFMQQDRIKWLKDLAQKYSA